MTYHIYCNQKSIRTHYVEAIAEFTKRLSAYCSTQLHCADNLSEFYLEYKANHALLWIQSGPSSYTSEEFASFINALQQQGSSTVHILIGYSTDELNALYEQLGYDTSVTFLSLTSFQLSTETIGLMCYEQLYRAYTILQGKTYHK
ncbi:MAG: 23S rRNA (pseudouridine(1915)-N(3))-methyltransferase RlmH [Lachnospiraceae bacterium]|nr:23S rRNA (pseudouridine(1915)-N(3))-methyltransferase RlmH [Lachnospiraceae bacterium]